MITSKLGINWLKINVNDPVHRAVLRAKIHEFMAKPMSNEFRSELAKAQEFTTSADFPTSVLQVFKKFQLTDNFDTSYEDIFDMIDITGSNRNGIDILDVQDALVFEKVLEGAKAKVYQSSGSKVHLYCDMYGGGLSWSRRLIDDQEYWTLENNAVSFRNKYYATRAANFYALIDALPGAQNVAWQVPAPAGIPNTDPVYNANRDAQTMNLAAQQILIAVANSGYGVTPQNVSFRVVCPIQLTGRLKQALGLVMQGFAGSPGAINYNFQLIPTMMLAATNVYYVVLPKQKLIGLQRMDLTIFSDFDPLSYSDLSVGWGRYGGMIGNVNQLRRCATI
jgi:hypothetical protein